MKKIVWFFGASRAGKATMIKKIDNNEISINILQKIGIDHPVFICENSLKIKDGGDSKRREPEMCEWIAELVNKGAETILIKGQTVDLRNNVVRKIRDSFPNYKHEVLFVFCDPDEVYKRIESENIKVIKDNSVKKRIEEVFVHQLPEIEKIENEFKITYIESPKYNFIDKNYISRYMDK